MSGPFNADSLFSEDNKKAALEHLKDKKNIGKIIEDYDEYKNADLAVLKTFIVDWFLGNYRKVELDTIAIMAVAVLYRVFPSDAIADKFPVVGLVDDKIVMALAVGKIALDIDNYKKWKDEENSRQILAIKEKFENAERLELLEIVEMGFSDYRFDVRDKVTRDTILFSQEGSKLIASLFMVRVTVFRSSTSIFQSIFHLLRNEVTYTEKIYTELTQSIEDDDSELNKDSKY